MSKKDSKKDLKNCIEFLLNEKRNDNHIIIADIDLKTGEGCALYRYLKTIYILRRFELHNTTKYEDNNYELVRFLPNYIPAAIELALNYMRENKRLGLNIYSETGLLIH